MLDQEVGHFHLTCQMQYVAMLMSSLDSGWHSPLKSWQNQIPEILWTLLKDDY